MWQLIKHMSVRGKLSKVQIHELPASWVNNLKVNKLTSSGTERHIHTFAMERNEFNAIMTCVPAHMCTLYVYNNTCDCLHIYNKIRLASKQLPKV